MVKKPNKNNPMKYQQKIELIVGHSDSNVRIDKYLHSHLPDLSRAYIQKLISKALILINNKNVKPSFKVCAGDSIEIFIPEPEKTALVPEDIPLDIEYEDEHLIVINKPAGMVVHPGAGVQNGTLVNALIYHCQDLSGVGGRLRPGIVHRLDKNTTGLLVVAKHDLVHLNLTKQLLQKSMIREYRALVWKLMEQNEGEIDTFLNRSKRDRKKFAVSNTGKKAVTYFKVLKRYHFLTYLSIILGTGRTHQIRAHMNYLNHPVFGDPEYHGRIKQLGQLKKQSEKVFVQSLLNKISRQALHAHRLEFVHPISGKNLNFETSLPKDMQEIIDLLEISLET